jgi:hypothetical protein
LKIFGTSALRMTLVLALGRAPEGGILFGVVGECLLFLELLVSVEEGSRVERAAWFEGSREFGLGLRNSRSVKANVSCEVLECVLTESAHSSALEAGGGSRCRKVSLIFKLHVSGILYVKGDELGPDYVQLELESRDGG